LINQAKKEDKGQLLPVAAASVRRGTKPNQKKKNKEAVDIMKMDITKLPNETESSLELLLNTLCRSCEMKPK
jgi:hypothetical protein